jgi:hypothetical protein
MLFMSTLIPSMIFAGNATNQCPIDGLTLAAPTRPGTNPMAATAHGRANATSCHLVSATPGAVLVDYGSLIAAAKDTPGSVTDAHSIGTAVPRAV